MNPQGIAKQYLTAKRNGWLPFFQEAAEQVSFVLDAADLMGIASRESDMNPLWLTVAGDRGNGYGLFQVDKRSYPQWVESGKWKDAGECALQAVIVLQEKWADLQGCIGKKRGVKSSKTGTMSYFVGKDVRGAEAKRVLIASYNCGRWAHYSVSNGRDVDTYSTGGNYSKDVMERAAAFRRLLQTNEPAAVPVESQPIPKPADSLTVPAEPPDEQPPDISVTQKPVLGRISDLTTWGQGVIDRAASLETSVSKSSWAVSIGKTIIGLAALIWGFAKDNPIEVIAGVAIIGIAAWYLTRSKDRAMQREPQ